MIFVMPNDKTSSAPTSVAGKLSLRLLLSGQNRTGRWLILLLWTASTALSIALGVVAVELDWSALPVSLGEHNFHITFYPPLIIAMFWLFWFGFWWACIPTWITTFILATYYGMAPGWAFLFAFSDPLGLALIAMIYRAIPGAIAINRPVNSLLFILVSFAGAVISSVGAFIWSHATQSPITGLFPIWEGWWLGFWLQNVVFVLPLLLLLDPAVRHWQGKTRLWQRKHPGRRTLQQTLLVALTLICTALVYTWFSAYLTQEALSIAAFRRDAHVWQPVALMAQDSLKAQVIVLCILMTAMVLFGVYLFRDWSARLTQSHQQIMRTNRRLNAEVHEREKIQAELQQGYQMLSLMAQLDSRLHAANNAPDVIAVLEEYLPRLLPQMEGVLCRITPDGQTEILLHWGRYALMGKEHASYLELPDITDNWHNPHLYDPDGKLGIQHVIPLLSDQHLAGAILLGQPPKEDRVVKQVLHTLGEHLSLALTNLRLRERLLDEATHDPLTGLYNRRFLYTWLQNEFERCRRHERQLSLLLIDIDHFKALNDSLGHDAGDKALQGLSDHLSSMIRHNDIACRLGGEEILLALAETDQRNAAAKAQRLCESVRSLQLFTENGQPIPALTISIGIAVFPSQAQTPSDLIRAADRAMYEAKARGRNRVCLAS